MSNPRSRSLSPFLSPDLADAIGGILALVVFSAASALLVCGCRGDGSSTNDGSPAEASKEIGAEGGSLESPDDRFVLQVPSGALTEEKDLTLRRVDDPPDGATSRVYRLGPEGLEFETPVRLKLELDRSARNSSDLQNLVLATWEEGKWRPLQESQLSRGDGTVSLSGRTSHFSLFAGFVDSGPRASDAGDADDATADDASGDSGTEDSGGEVCDGEDNDGDGVVDESCPCNYLGKTDGVCGSAKIDEQGNCAKPPSFEKEESSCSDGADNDCDRCADRDASCGGDDCSN